MKKLKPQSRKYDSKYQQAYYQKNKEKIAAQRALKLENDPDYAEKKRQYNRRFIRGKRVRGEGGDYGD